MRSATTGDCKKKCWAAAAVVGALVFFAFILAGQSFVTALILGLIAFGLLGMLLVWLGCSAEASDAAATVPGAAAAARTSAAASPAAAVVAPTPQADPQPEAEPVSEQAALAERAEPEAEARADVRDDETRAGDAPTPDTPAPATMAGADDIEEAEKVPLIKPSSPLAGQAELAERKGSWTYKGDKKP